MLPDFLSKEEQVVMVFAVETADWPRCTNLNLAYRALIGPRCQHAAIN